MAWVIKKGSGSGNGERKDISRASESPGTFRSLSRQRAVAEMCLVSREARMVLLCLWRGRVLPQNSRNGGTKRNL